MADIDFSEFRTLNNFAIRQPLYPFVEITIGGVKITDFDDDMGDTVMDLSYRRTAHQNATDVSGDTFTLTLYDDTAIEVESLIYNVILKTTHQAEENLSDEDTKKDENSENDTDSEDGDESSIDSDTGDSSDDEDTNNNEEKSPEDMWAEALEQINNIDISYGWVDMNGNKFLDRSIQGNYSKYSLEFEGASSILTIEGKSVASSELNSPSSSSIAEYSAEEYGGVPSTIVKSIVDSIPTLKYTDKTIEETEPLLDKDGKPRSFTQNGETYEAFIKKYLCEEAKSKKSGKVGYKFYTDSGLAYFVPSDTPKDVKVETKTKIKKNKSVKKVAKNKKSGYDKGSASYDIVNKDDSDNKLGSSIKGKVDGIEFSDELDEYDELDEFDKVDYELDEDDLPEDTDYYTGLTEFGNERIFDEPTDEELEEIDLDLGDFESSGYIDFEYELDDIEDDTENFEIDEEDIIDESIIGKERPPWLRKFGIKLEL